MDHSLRTQSAEKNADKISMQAAKALQLGMAHINEDLNFISELRSIKEFLNDSRNNEHVAELFSDFLVTRKDYFQMRILGTNGMELVRVDSVNNRIRIMDDRELQNKSDRYYFKEAMKLNYNEVYQSQIDLNKEYGQIEHPWRPTIRFAQMVFEKGKPLGLIIINVNMQNMFDDILQINGKNDNTFIVNKDGYFIMSDDPRNNWGFMFNRPQLTLKKMNPALWLQINKSGQQDGQISIGSDYFSVQKICSGNLCPDRTDNTHYIANSAKDMPWFVVTKSKTIPLANLEWIHSEWPYLLAGLIVLAILMTLRISTKMSKSSDSLRLQRNQLDTSVHRFSKVIEAIPDGLIILGNDKLIETVNPAAETILGLKPEELIGNSIEVIMTGRFKEQHYARTDSFYDKPRKIEVTRERPYAYKHPNGSTRYLQALISPMTYEGKVFAIVLVKDATTSIKQEEQIRQSQKLDALGQLTGGVAHDFNNLLAVMLGNLELLEMQAMDQPKLLERVNKIMKAVGTASDLTQKLLTVSRRKTLSTQQVDLEEFMYSVMDMLKRTIKERVKIDFKVEANLPKVMIDPNELTNAMINLSVNARDAMPDGGSLFIKVENVHLDKNYVESVNDNIAVGDYVLISFEDTGTGIPKELIDKVLEPFFTTKPKGKGTGLGLAMIYGFIKQSKGHMRIYSEEGAGTNIHMYIPAMEQSAEEAIKEKTKKNAVPVSWGQYRGLVVDDEVDLAEVAATYLELTGMTVDVVHNADLAWEKLMENEYDIVFSDIVMPGEIDGIGLYKKMRENALKTEIILASGFSEELLAKQYHLKEKLIFIKKPYKRDDMIAAVGQALEKL